MKKPRNRSVRSQNDIATELRNFEQPHLVEISNKIHALNKRDAKIQARLGTINAEAAKLSAEQNGNAIRRLELLRQHDAAAEG